MKSPRIDAIITAFHGPPRSVLQDAVTDVYDALSEEQQNRLEAAVNETLCVFPERPGFYRIYSPDGEQGGETEYTVDIKYKEAKTCTCGDFMFRLEASKGQMCKHIWKTYVLITLGVLPEPDADPYPWLLEELEKDTKLLEAAAETDPVEDAAAQMRELHQEVQNTHEIAVEYPLICTKRADILSDATTS